MVKPSRGRPKESGNISSPEQTQSQAASSQRPAHRQNKVGRALEHESQGKRKRGRPKKMSVACSPESSDEDNDETNSNLPSTSAPTKTRQRKKQASQVNADNRTPMAKRLRSATQNP